MNLLKTLSLRLQKVNEQLGQLNAEIIDTELIRQSNLNDWKNRKEKELNSCHDDEGKFIFEF